jgi:hypothetical protein
MIKNASIYTAETVLTFFFGDGGVQWILKKKNSYRLIAIQISIG